MKKYKKNKIIMSVGLVVVLLLLLVFSFRNKQISSFLGIDNLKKNFANILDGDTNTTKSDLPVATTAAGSESNTLINKYSLDYMNDNSVNMYKTIVPDYKLKSMNEQVQVGLYNSYSSNYIFLVRDAKITKTLPDYGMMIHPDRLNDLGSEYIDSNGNIIKGYYYLDVEISVTNTGIYTGTFKYLGTSFCLSSFPYILISGSNHDAIYRGYYYSENSNCGAGPYIYKELDGKNLIGIGGAATPFPAGETLDYRACYIVPEGYNKDDLNFMFYDGGKRSIEDADQRFIKVEVQ